MYKWNWKDLWIISKTNIVNIKPAVCLLHYINFRFRWYSLALQTSLLPLLKPKRFIFLLPLPHLPKLIDHKVFLIFLMNNFQIYIFFSICPYYFYPFYLAPGWWQYIFNWSFLLPKLQLYTTTKMNYLNYKSAEKPLMALKNMSKLLTLSYIVLWDLPFQYFLTVFPTPASCELSSLQKFWSAHHSHKTLFMLLLLAKLHLVNFITCFQLSSVITP